MDRIHSLLGSSIYILISDGRWVEGELLCLDKDLNIVLGDSTEYHGVSNMNFLDNVQPRKLGMVVIPGAHIVKCMRKAIENVV